MKKKGIILFFYIGFGTVLFSCPLCNIHNYLNGSIKGAYLIYTAQVIDTVSEYKSLVEVNEIIKNDTAIISVGEKRLVNVYPSMKEVGEKYIFSATTGWRGPQFDILTPDFLWEVKYILNEAPNVYDGETALRLVECIGNESVRNGIAYIESNYDECFPLLEKRIRQFRRLTFSDPDSPYAEYRIRNLVKALVSANTPKSHGFFLEEIDSILYYCPQNLTRPYPFNGETPKGEYLRGILELSKEKSDILYTSTYKKYNDFINKDTSENLKYVAYALAFDQRTNLDYSRFSVQKKNHLAHGLVWAMMWCRYWRQHEEKDRLLNAVLEFNTDPAIAEYLEKYVRN